MKFDLSRWRVGPLIGNKRLINGTTITVIPLGIKQRYDIGRSLAEVMGGRTLTIAELLDPLVVAFVHRLVGHTDAPEDLFDDLTYLIPVAATVCEVYLEGLFEGKSRMALSESKNREVVKALRKKTHPDGSKIAPNVEYYWFLFRPIYSELCTYREMFKDEIFTFAEIHELHEILDLKQFHEITAQATED